MRERNGKQKVWKEKIRFYVRKKWLPTLEINRIRFEVQAEINTNNNINNNVQEEVLEVPNQLLQQQQQHHEGDVTENPQRTP